jgi:hypothetical protein
MPLTSRIASSGGDDRHDRAAEEAPQDGSAIDRFEARASHWGAPA